jgi:N-acetylglucosamine malate deacetylase 1
VTHQKKVLVVAAHPDDEILGCGGTMIRHVDEGDEVHVVFMADGVTSRSSKETLLDEINKRKKSAIEACKIVGTQQPVFLGLLDNQMDTYSMLEITQKLEKIIIKIEPNIVYTHNNKDLNIDHQLTHKAVMTACRPQPKRSVSKIYSFEILSSTGWGSSTTENVFTPNMYVDITKEWKKKLTTLGCYNNEVKSFPHARSYKSIEALAVYRGSHVGVDSAEAFYLERGVSHYYKC